VVEGSQEHHDLIWALEQVMNGPPVSPFWAGAAAAHHLKLAGHGPDSPLRKFADELQTTNSSILDGTARASGALAPGWDTSLAFSIPLRWPPPIIGLEVARDEHPVRHVAPGPPSGEEISWRHYDPWGGSGSSWKQRCCVHEFLYPDKWKIRDDPILPGVWNVGAEFTLGATYIELPPCECACCLFKQFVLYKEELWAVKEFMPDWHETPLVRTNKEHVEDCHLVAPDGSYIRAFEASAADMARLLAEGYKPDCYAGRWSDEDTRSVREITSTADTCKWCDYDRFYVRMGSPVVFRITYDFVGKIYDTCRDWIVVESRRFQVVRGGLAWSPGWPGLVGGIPGFGAVPNFAQAFGEDDLARSEIPESQEDVSCK
jgi:hypothetical protein